ncbi:unnamed protein product [Allacma fusca]|uniref:Ubiquitin-like protein n=1 Tax=Allacma fusca TaxID=39272 RepID=A0A8J2L5J5_9HEXA|nr:unnamed protein product [Allacma fusca]
MDPLVNSSPMKIDGEKLPSLYLWYFHDKSMKKATLEEADLKELTVQSLKEIAVQSKPELGLTVNANEIDILYNGKVLPDDPGATLESLKVKPNTAVHIIKKLGSISAKKQEEFEEFKKQPLKVISPEVIAELATALKTMILSPTFYSAVDDLSDPKTLKAVLAVVPNLKYDPIGIAIIQDPSMILYLADEESLKSLAKTRPWVVEAFSFIAAGIHQQEAKSTGRAQAATSSRTPGLHSLLSYMRQIYDEDEEGQELGGLPGAAAGGADGTPPPQITRQQLVAALESFSNLQRAGPLQSTSQGPSTSRNTAADQRSRVLSDPFRLFSPSPRPSSTPAPPTGGGTPSTPPPLSGEMVARAMRDAISQLPADQRAAQLNAIRNLALSLNQQNNESPAPVARPPAAAPSQPLSQPQSTTNPTTSSSLASQYSDQLAQMREMGIFDERLSVLALRVSEGDLATAVELIFSGWQGEGVE